MADAPPTTTAPVLLARTPPDPRALRAAVGCSARGCVVATDGALAFTGEGGALRLVPLADGERDAIHAAVATRARAVLDDGEALVALLADLRATRAWRVAGAGAWDEDRVRWLVRLAGRLGATVWTGGAWWSARRGALLPAE